MKHVSKRVLTFVLALVMVLSYIPWGAQNVLAAEGDSVLDTKVTGLTAAYSAPGAVNAKYPGTIAWNAAENDNGSVTISGSVEGYYTGKAYRAETATLTLTNTLEGEAVLSFDYTAAVVTYNKDSISIDGTVYAGLGSASGSATGSGYFEKTLQSNESIEITMSIVNKSGTSNKATIELKNVNLGLNPVVTTTFLPAENGSYTVTVGDVTTDITEETTLSNKATTNYTLTATPAEGYSFAGWYNQTKNVYIGAGAVSENVRFEDETSVAQVVPLFVKTEEAVYGVGEARFADFKAAMTYAKNATDKVVVQLKDDTLASGSYTVPAGVTLLVPFDDANTLYTDKPGCTSSKNNNVAWVTPTAYRTLTMSDGAELTVNGTISIGSQHAAGGQQTAGSPTGPYGHIAMNSGSKITLENGSKLYAWGYVTGSGTITANSGAQVYENLQITDFRGGNASVQLVPSDETDPLLNEKKVFPFTQYYVQNIEVALTLYSGAVESVYATMYALDDVYSTAINFIGTQDSMFYIGEGSYVVKDYDPTTDRLIISAYGTGEIEVNGLSVTLAGTTLASSMFNLPITSNITINVNGGNATINQDAALLPGSQVNIAQGASMTMGAGYNVFVYDSEDWTKGYANIYDSATQTYSLVWTEDCNFVHDNVKIRPVSFSPSGKATRTADSLTDATVDVNGTLYVDGNLYTTAGGANITSSMGTGMVWLNADPGDLDHTNQATQVGTDVTLVNIPVAPAWLKNADGSYTETATAEGGSGYSWNAVAGEWSDSATVYFDGNGAEGAVESQQVTYLDIYWEENEITLPDGNGFTKAGSTFTGWNTKADGSGDAYESGDSFTVTGNVTLYAQWEVKKYTLTFLDENGDELTDLSAEVEEGEFYTLPAVPAKTGFEGYWNVEGYGAFEAGQEVEILEDTTFQAQYNVQVFDLFFDANGGCFYGDPDDTVAGAADGYDYGYVIDDHGTPEREGYEFIGWNTAKDGSGTAPVFGETTLTADTTYYAQWKIAIYTLTFLDENGNELTDLAAQVMHGESYTLPAVPEKTGFEGYWEAEGYGAFEADEEVEILEDTTFQAQYNVQVFDLFFDANGGCFNGDPDWTVLGAADGYDYGYVILDHGTPDREGYEFVGWNTAKDGSGTAPVFGETTLTADTTYYAQWKIATYTITWLDEDGTELGTTTVEHGTVPTFADPTKEADAGYTYTFDGWTPAVVAATEDTSYMATYTSTANTYTVTFTINGEKYKELDFAYGAQITAPAYETPYGYNFSGWIVPNTMPAKDITVDATLAAKTYTVSVINYQDGCTFTLSNESAIYGQAFSTVLTANVGSGIDVSRVYAGSNIVDFAFDPATGKLTVAAEDVIGNIKIYADATVLQIMDVNGGVISDEYREMVLQNGGVIEGDLITLPMPYGTTGKLTGVFEEYISKTGHTHVGYTDKDGNVYSFGDTYVMDKDMTLTMTWKANEHTVTWIIDGVESEKTVAYGTALNAPADPSKEGHTFTGWEGEIPATMPDEDITITLTSKWDINKYTVTWVDEDGETVDTETVEYGKNATKTPAVPAKTGHTGKWDAAATNVKADVTIKPVYTAIEYCIHFWSDKTDTAPIATNNPHYYGEALSEDGWSIMIDAIADRIPEKEGYSVVGWVDADGNDITEITSMPARDLDVYAVWQVNTYTVTWDNGNGGGYEKDFEYGAEITIPTSEIFEETFRKTGYTLTGWEGYTEGMTMPAKNVTFTAQYTVNKYVLTIKAIEFNEVSGNPYYEPIEIEVPYGAKLAECIPDDVRAIGETVAVDGTRHKGTYTITGWESWDEENGYVAIDIATATMPAGEYAIYNTFSFTGWEHTDAGIRYLIDSSVAYFDTIAHIDGEAYLFNEEGYIVAGAGLVRHVTEEGVVEYYYFEEESYTALKSTSKWIENVHDLLPVWEYAFDENGVIPHHEDTSRNGIHTDEEGRLCYYIDGVKAYIGLTLIDGDYYYVRSNGQLAVDCNYWISKTNGYMKEGSYPFDAEGKMIIKTAEDQKNGIYAEDGSLYYYKDGVRNYAGLIKIDGEYYYVKTNCEAVHGGIFYITKTNGYMKPGNYNFDDSGKMIPMPEEEAKFTGIKDGYYYKDDVLYYAGLIEIDGFYYYVNSSCKVVTSCTYWISKTNGLKDEKAYTFDAQGRMIIGDHPDVKTGLYEENGKTYYYVEGVKTYAGLIEIDGYFYYVKSDCSIVKDGQFWITKTNGYVTQGRYTFDAEGRMVN